MGTYLTADLHLEHAKVAELRGFTSAHDHDLAVARAWSRVVRPGDEVWVLGDVALGDRASGLRLLAGLPGIKHLITGNHDRVFAALSGAHHHQDAYREAFASVSLHSRAGKLLLSHFPYEGDHGEEDREAQWRLRDLGAPLAHGHTHSNKQVSRTSLGTPQVCVSLDTWGMRPAPLTTVRTLAGLPS